MRKSLYILIMFLNIGIVKAELPITAQYPDKITYNGTEYSLNSNPLEPYFEKNPENRPDMVSTALWRGYVGHFEIIDSELYLIDMTRPIGFYKDEEGNSKQRWISIYKRYFPRQDKVKIDWFTGILILPYGDLVEYVHQGYASLYSHYLLLEIENGRFNESREYGFEDFIEFKRRQFNEYRKTKEYQKLYADLKKSDESIDESFIQQFMLDFVINYTSKFLTE